MIEALTSLPTTFSIYIGIGLLWVLYLEKIVYKQPVGTYFEATEIFLFFLTWPYTVIIYFITLIRGIVQGFQNRNLK